MSEFYINKYVVKVTTGHLRYTSYTLLSTREDMKTLVDKLSAALNLPEENLLSQWLTAEEPTELWSDYATIAYGETSRVYLSFAFVNNLNVYHVQPKPWKAWLSVLGCLAVIALFALAVIGLIPIHDGKEPDTSFTALRMKG